MKYTGKGFAEGFNTFSVLPMFLDDGADSGEETLRAPTPVPCRIVCGTMPGEDGVYWAQCEGRL